MSLFDFSHIKSTCKSISVRLWQMFSMLNPTRFEKYIKFVLNILFSKFIKKKTS